MFLGNIETSFSWKDGSVSAASLTFNSFHPWLNGLKEENGHPGFFKVDRGSDKNISDFDYIPEGRIFHNNLKSEKRKTSEHTSNRSVEFDNEFIEITVSTPNKLRVYPKISNWIQGLGSSPFIRQCESLQSSTITSSYCSFDNDNNKNDGNNRNNINNHINCDESVNRHRASKHWIEGKYF